MGSLCAVCSATYSEFALLLMQMRYKIRKYKPMLKPIPQIINILEFFHIRYYNSVLPQLSRYLKADCFSGVLTVALSRFNF